MFVTVAPIATKLAPYPHPTPQAVSLAAAVLSFFNRKNGGEGRIRTHETLAGLTVFKTAAFDRSATSPYAVEVDHRNFETVTCLVYKYGEGGI